MSTITATILVGTAHPYDGGIQPTHMIQMTENSRIALHLHAFASDPHVRTFTDPTPGRGKVFIPTPDQTIDDIFLIISTYILRAVNSPVQLHGPEKKSFSSLLDKEKRAELYGQSKSALQGLNMKVVFHLLDNSHLLRSMDQIEAYPCDFEITKTFKKRLQDGWSNLKREHQGQKQ
jgi:hypothetical protein